MLYIWLGVIVALILIELFSRNLTAACFIVSAIVSCCLCTIFHEEYVLQVCAFLVLGVLLLIFARPNILIHLKNYEKENSKTKKEEKKEEIKEEKKITTKKNTKSPKTKKSVKK